VQQQSGRGLGCGIGGRRLFALGWPQTGGLFLEPAILDQFQVDIPTTQEEIFGPVLAVLSFNGDSQVLRIVNSQIFINM
jgi:acyl-CoA reductase-like NAD-dependent aldehyde dehydrogenase